MIRKCFKTNTGIMFDARSLRELGLDPARLFPQVLPRPPPLPVGIAKIQPVVKSQRGADIIVQSFAVEGVLEPGGGEAAAAGMEEEEELRDTLSPVYDQLSIAPFWWILEVLPLKHKYQKGDASWANVVGFVFFFS